MSEISKAVRVYQAVFRKEPRPHTLHILQSMELAFGLQEDELLTHLAALIRDDVVLGEDQSLAAAGV